MPFTAATIDSMSHQPVVTCTVEAPSVESAEPTKAVVCTRFAGSPDRLSTSDTPARNMSV